MAPIIMRTILTVIVVGLLASCSASYRESPAPVAVSSSPTPADEGLPQISHERMISELARLSKQTGVGNLKTMRLADSQTELRLWKAFGIVYPVCFILRIDNGNATASLASPKVIADKAVFEKSNPVYVNTPLNAPHSGWPNLLTYLRQNGIDSSIKLSLDKRYKPYPDAEALILEMKTGSLHTMTHYIDSTVCDDGKKAFAICIKIQNEFDIQLSCKS